MAVLLVGKEGITFWGKWQGGGGGIESPVPAYAETGNINITLTLDVVYDITFVLNCDKFNDIYVIAPYSDFYQLYEDGEMSSSQYVDLMGYMQELM